MAVHVVKPGESLWSISQKYGIPIETIVALNGLRYQTSIIPGLALYIAKENEGFRIYRITYGDTLWLISRKNQVPIQTILSMNPGIDPGNLLVGQPVILPAAEKSRIQTLGYIVPYSEKESFQLIKEYAEFLTYIAIVAYSLNEEGDIIRLLEDTSVINEIKKKGLSPLLMIRNVDFEDETFNAELIGRVLENPKYRKNLINSLIKMVKEKGYAGISIDFEFVPPERRKEFNQFFMELKDSLADDLILHVNVHAKTEDVPTNPIIGAYDYETIGRYADIVAVMTMDYGYPTGPPNPVSPIWWMDEVIAYTTGLIKPRKLQMGLPLYGYDWKLPENITKARSILNAQNLAISTGAVIQYNTYAAAPWYRYWVNTEAHIVWFEDIRSYIEKYKLLDKYNLLGVTYWKMSFPFPQNWAYLSRNFTISKI